MAILNRPTPVSDTERMVRPRVGGKFLWVGDRKLYISGVTYGTFRPDDEGNEYGPLERVERDFAQMVEYGINAVRTYTVPPRPLLDAAHRHGLWVMVGLPWEQHIAFLDDRERAQDIEERVRSSVAACSGHPALLCYTIGNEIPASIVRWHGAQRVETFLKRLYDAAKEADPGALVTYVNYPTTEYLDLSFVDFLCFNVYLEREETLEAYLARLQNIAGDRPLLMAEIGLDSRRNGLDGQARSLDWQVRTAFAGGCAGVFLFAWTDEWYRGGYDIEDWDFGLVDRQRQPKPALSTVQDAFTEIPFPRALEWPHVSVVVCSHNGARTLDDTCEGLAGLTYPEYDVILVDDGSTDGTAEIGRRYGFRVISTPNGGLSAARNLGLAAAAGPIVAYTDDDARPDPDWLTYLVASFLRSEHAGIGGPNIAPRGDGPIAECVANAPGGPVHVLLTDGIAEHIPGCNMAFRKEALDAIGGFDPRFRAAGDDVDICWRLQQRGWTLGFSPAAMVWHHRRNSVRTYWKQQKGYGRAEALLEEKWPQKYNRAGHVSWGGRLYGRGLTLPVPWSKARIYGGSGGAAPFQSLYQPAPGMLRSLPLMPEWYLVVMVLAGLSALGLLWHPLLLTLPLLVLAVLASLVQAVTSAGAATFDATAPRATNAWLRLLTALLHLMQPAARLWGRIAHGLTPWRRRGNAPLVLPARRTTAVWSDEWVAPDVWVGRVEAAVRGAGGVVTRGGEFDPWDLEVRSGQCGAIRILSAVEEHGGGKQFVRFRSWPRPVAAWSLILLILAGLALGAALGHAWIAAVVLATGWAVGVVRAIVDLTGAAGLAQLGVDEVGGR